MNHTSMNVHASGDQYIGSVLNLVEPKQLHRCSITKRQGDADSYSYNSLKVNISDLADVKELEKIAQQQKESSSFVEQSNRRCSYSQWISTTFQRNSHYS